MSSNGTVLMLMDNVVFRKVLPEQIQMAIAAQSTPEDATRPQGSKKLCVPSPSPLSFSPSLLPLFLSPLPDAQGPEDLRDRMAGSGRSRGERGRTRRALACPLP